MNKEKVVVLNAGRMDFDGSLDFRCISPGVTVYESTAPEQMTERVQGADAIVTKEIPVTKDMIDAFPESLRLICEAGTGYNNIDLAAARAKGVTVCNVPAYSTERVAHTAIMLMLNLSSSIQQQIRMLERGDRRNFTEHLLVAHTELNGKTLGIIGEGAIGRKVAQIALALDMQALIFTRTPRPDSPGITHVSLRQLLQSSDYVSLHCPLNGQTRHMINADTLAMMKKTAYLINTARGALIDEPALIQALQTGVIAGAGLDVQETEPPDANSPLYTMDNVILTPHMGWKGTETRQRLLAVVADNVQSYFTGKPKNVVG